MQNQVRRMDLPSAIVTGGGSRNQLGKLARELGASRVLLVTDPGVIELGFASEVERVLAESGLDVRVFSDVQPDPTDRNVESGVAELAEHKSDLVIALGGGSPIDTAKVIAIRAANPAPLPDFMGLHKIANPGVPLIAVPTTAGTGSEATKVAVITDSSASADGGRNRRTLRGRMVKKSPATISGSRTG
ncbi:MAG: alcohol dehydrogenase class IV [Verrucomicrobiales bacterium]|jgi:alcohol dehydrogenase class IV